MSEKIIYVGLFLTEESRKKLLALFPPKHPKVTADHLTMAFKPSAQVMESLNPMLGMKVRLHLLHYASDEKGQAVSVQKGSLPYCENEHPHITISCADGVSPVYSNELLEKHDKPCQVIPLPDLVLESVIDTWPRQKKDPEPIKKVMDRVMEKYVNPAMEKLKEKP